MQISNHVFIVTGGASGLGGATTRMLAANGGKVVIADVQADRGEALARELGAHARYVKCDVSSEADGRPRSTRHWPSGRCVASSTAPASRSAKRSSARKARMRSRRLRASSTST